MTEPLLIRLRRAVKVLLRRVTPSFMNRVFWEIRGKTYSQEPMSAAYLSMYEELVALGTEVRPRSVLEFGCGHAYLLGRIAASAGPRVRLSGIDFSSSQLAQAKALLPDAAFTLQDLARPLEFPDKAFDLVLGVSVLMYLTEADARAAAAELHRVCGRRLMLAEFSRPHLDPEGQRRFDDARSYDGRQAHDYPRLLADAGFSSVEVRRFRGFTDPSLNKSGEMPQTLFLAEP